MSLLKHISTRCRILTKFNDFTELSKVQDDEVGDGTTSVVVLASELLREAEKLCNTRIHPQTIVSGFRKATDCALQTLIASAQDHGFPFERRIKLSLIFGYRADPVAFRQDLINIAKTTLSSKILTAYKDYFSELAVDAVLRLKV